MSDWLTARHTAQADGLPARVMLSFLATAGLFYVNIMPAIVDGLIQGLGFSSQAAGAVGSANVYGAAVGALAIVFLVRRIRWRPMAAGLLAALVAMDLLSIFVAVPEALIAFRFVHGLVGGALVGVAFSVIARADNPDRTFGVLLVVQFGLGGLGNLYLPRLVPLFSVDVLFVALIAFSVATALMLPFLDRYPVIEKAVAGKGTARGRVAMLPLGLTLAAIFLFQASNMGLFAFIIGLGRHYGQNLQFITTTLALSGWIGIAGAVLVVVLHTRFGRLRPLLIAVTLTAAGFLVLHASDSAAIFLVANCAMGVTWAFTIPYLLGLCAAFDTTGQMAALGGFASKMGLASGPLVSGFLLGEDNYGLLINVGAVVVFSSLLVSAWPAMLLDRRPVPVPNPV